MSNLTYRMNLENLKKPFFEMGPIRPPSEGRDHSLLIRASRNCPWNRCLFCGNYKGEKFVYRPVPEIKGDIDIARTLHDAIKAASQQLGLGGRVTSDIVRAIYQGNPEIYDNHDNLPFQNLINVANWTAYGAKTIFLQDANSLIMRTPELLQVITHLKETFPTLERLTSYARAKTCDQKSLEELEDLHHAGLSRLHVGLESGNDEVLSFMQKGITSEEHITGGRKVVASGIELSEYFMPGLGGRRWSENHAPDSARVLSEINPDFIRLRSLVIHRNTPLYTKLQEGEFEELSEDEVVDEIELFIKNLSCGAYVISDQMSNLLFNVEGQLPEDKEKLLERIARYKQKHPMARLEFRLKHRLQSYLGVYGGISPELRQLVEDALESIQTEAPDAELKTNQAILALKRGFV